MSWKTYINPVAKASAAAAIDAVTAANCSFSDLLGADDPQFAAQLAAAQAAAVAALAGMTGDAQNVQVSMGGRSDPSTSAAVPGAAGGEITVTILERWI
jgi:hypothetical protein